MKVLLAEDDSVSMLILRRSAESLGHTCVAARDGLAAWDAFHADKPDVVISDWLMPGMDGIELCRKIREHEAEGARIEAEGGGQAAAAYTYFLFMTSLSDKQHFLIGMQAGADDYLSKPVDLDDLRVRLIVASRVTSLHRKLLEQNAALARLGRQSHEAARTDPLTRVSNRLRLREDLEALRGELDRRGRRCSVALCDIDDFLKYNDFYGHLAGDETLLAVARTIASELGPTGALYRYGGEEFLAILPEQDEATAARTLERIRLLVEQLALPHQGRGPAGVVTLSAGVAGLSAEDAPPWDGWIRRADQSLYRAKQQGRNRICRFSERGPEGS